MKERIQFKLNNRIFAVKVETSNRDYEEIINNAYNELEKQIQANNETIHNIFFEELEIVCGDCGIGLNNGEEKEDLKCLQCINNKGDLNETTHNNRRI